MKKTTVAFFGIEKWEQDYLKDKLVSIKTVFPVFSSGSLNSAILNKIKNTEILCVFVWSQVDERVINKLPNLKFISTMSTGFDHIDLRACKDKKIKVSNVPFYGDNTVAEHTFALILALTRKLPESIERTRQGNFTLDGLQGIDLKGKTIGIIGLGHIGSKVAEIANGFGMKIIACDPKQDLKLKKKLKIQYKDLNHLLSNSDVISLHAPYSKETHHLINKTNISKIKKGALLINTSRGGLVDSEALIMALDKDILAGGRNRCFRGRMFYKRRKRITNKTISENL